MTTVNGHDAIEQTKQEISEALKEALVQEGISIRKLAHNVGMQHPQVLRITGGDNYTINNLVKILDGAGLRLKIEKK